MRNFLFPVAAAIACMTSPADADGGTNGRGIWVKVATDEGCLVFWKYYPKIEALSEFRHKVTFSYEGSGCQKGRLINGHGTLVFKQHWKVGQRSGSDDQYFEGDVVNGALNGEMHRAFSGGPGGSLIQDRNYLYVDGGCFSTDDDCAPFPGGRSSTPAEATADNEPQTAQGESSAPEPGPLGLHGKTINNPEQPDNPSASPPQLVEGRNDGPFAYCFKVQMDKPFVNKEHDWETVFRLVSKCDKEILYRFDSAEFEGGDLISYTARGSYPTNGGGIPGYAVWPDNLPLPPELGFEPRNPFRQGEGVLYRGPPNWLGGGLEPGTYRVSQNAPRRLIKYYIVSCPRYDEQTGRENVMWVSGNRLMDSDTKFKCLPGPPPFNGNGPLQQ